MFERPWDLITGKPISHADITVGPSAWGQTHAAKIVPGGRVLDYACGSGRHAIWMAKQGFDVVAIDRDQASLDQIKSQQASIRTENIDLEAATWSLDHLGTFDAVVVTNYLYRPFLKKLPTLLNSQGVLIYETFALGNEAFGKPSNPDFLLKPNELLGFSENMQILAFEDRLIDEPKPACIQRVCAVPLQSKP